MNIPPAVLAVVAVALACTAAVAPAQSNPAGSGHWEGAIQFPDRELKIAVDLAQNDKGEWIGSIDFPAQGADGFPLSKIAPKGAAVEFTIDYVPGDCSFRGDLAPSGRTIRGSFTEGGLPLTFEMKWVSEPHVKFLPESGPLPITKEIVEDVPGTVWRATLRDPGAGVSGVPAATTESGSRTWLVARSDPRQEPGPPARASLVQVDSKGKTVSTTDLKRIFPGLEGVYLDHALVAATEGRVYLCVREGEGAVRLTGFDSATGKLVLDKIVPLDDRGIVVATRLLSVSEDALVLMGGDHSGGFIAKLTTSGTLQWKKPAGEDVDDLVDGLKRRGGGFVALGAKYRTREVQVARLYAIEFDPEGKVIRKSVLPGEPSAFAPPNIAQGASGRFVVLLNRPNGPGSPFDVWVQGLDAVLQPTWSRQLGPLLNFQIQPVASGGYVVAVERGAGLWVFRIREDGEPVWTHVPHPLEPFSTLFTSVTLMPAGPDFVLAANVMVTTTDWTYATDVIRLIRFRTN